MSKAGINKREFNVVGELTEDGQFIKIAHYKPLKRIFKALIGQPLDVSFKQLKYQRSAAQNRALWGVAYVTIAAWYKETNGEAISKDAIHAHTLQRILDYEVEVKEVYGTEIIVVKGKSTSALNTKEFTDLYKKIQKYWAEKGCDIPDPRGNNFLSDFIKDE
jgi:hypothetical protein